MTPFDPRNAQSGAILYDIDPASLQANRPELERSRLETQRQLIAAGIRRYSMIQVNCVGVVLNGNHGARAAAEVGVAIDVFVTDLPHLAYGPILQIPVVNR
jgi:hypothetical protein